ncbi:hypothetical protein [Thermotalea metallivorans]|uniref:Uncharacterized protein n=1 Tax=Thermotalea metallivorans TaxID=520762 RepID=A0A140L8A8_9FIRM|nr:hypothetical protein [Thermotalea metallivorans]KXG76783.1 hypothetical protein AN619_07750 [Thermotalea metallivorans]
MRKILKSNKGSIFMMVLIVFSVLSILGMAMIPLAVANYKMKVIDKRETMAFYKAEGILEEVHAVILKEVQKAVAKANQHVADNLDTLITQHKNPNTGKIDDKNLQDAMGRIFVQKYKEYINTQLKDAIKNNTYKISGTYLYDSAIDIIDVFDTNDYTDNDVFSVVITGSYVENHITKAVCKKFTIKADRNLIKTDNFKYEYPEPYFINTANYNLKENTLLNTKAITAENGIEINGNVGIYGNIFSGAAIQIKQGATVNIQDGAIATKGDIIIESNTVFNSKGDVYCDSFLVPKSTSYANITIGEETGDPNTRFRLITKDDLELNGTKSHITIHGSYYGFTSDDGGVANTGNPKNKRSSAIIINSRDIGNGSSLFISGKPSANDFEITYEDGTPMFKKSNGIYVGGTSYIDVEEEKDGVYIGSEYQTGESVSLPGNYIAYTDQVELDGDYAELDYKKHRYSIDGSYYGFHLATNKRGESAELSLADKKKMLSNAYSKYKDILFFNTANATALRLENFEYSTGNFVSEGLIKDAIGGIEKYLNVKRIIKKDYEEKTYSVDISTVKPTPPVKIGRGNAVASRNEICYIGDKVGDKGVVIRGPHAPAISGDYYVFDFNTSPYDTFHGIIVTDGDVILAGKIDFKGIIASGGKVVFYNDGERKTVKHENIEIYDDQSASIDGIVLDYRKYQHLVEVSDWKIKR